MMENVQLVGLSRQVALRRDLDVTANNLANMQTTGFKKSALTFEEFMMAEARQDSSRRPDEIISYVVDRATWRDFSPGTMRQTAAPLDVAIAGEGFFAVQTPNGERYTRDGSFKLDPEGQLVTSSGFPVMGAAGPIVIGPEDTDIAIAQDGTISSQNGEIAQLQVVGFDDPENLVSEGENLFAAGDAVAQPVEMARLQQGMLEASNVVPVAEMTRMIEINRAYQSLANVMKQTDDLRRSAISTLSRVS